jgi:anti-sigma-K factor RskA
MTPLSLEAMRELAPGYAMGTLTPAEHADFERAMADPSLAAELQLEVDAHRATLEALATAHSAQPSPALRARTLARMTSEPQRHTPTAVLPLQRRRSNAGPWLTGGLVTALAASVVFSVNLNAKWTSFACAPVNVIPCWQRPRRVSNLAMKRCVSSRAAATTWCWCDCPPTKRPVRPCGSSGT